MSATRPYIVRSGEYLAKIAMAEGFDTQDTWEAPENNSLVASGRDPGVLLAGDVLRLPPRAARAQGLRLGASNVFSAHIRSIAVSVRILELDSPVADAACRVSWDDTSQEMRTDSQGQIVFDVPVMVRGVRVYFPERNAVYELAVGDLDPCETPSGVAQRLGNLGYLRPSYEESLADDSLLAGAQRRFLRDRGDDTDDGEVGAKKLKEVHGR